MWVVIQPTAWNNTGKVLDAKEIWAHAKAVAMNLPSYSSRAESQNTLAPDSSRIQHFLLNDP